MKTLRILIVILFFWFASSIYAQHQVNIQSFKAFPGDTIIVPINLQFGASAPNPPIDAYGCKLEFPQQLLEFDTTINAGTLTATWFLSKGQLVSDSTISIGGFNFIPITTSGVLLKVRFIVRPNASGKDSLKLTGLVDDLSKAIAKNGFLRVPAAPVLTKIPDQIINEGTAFTAISLDDYIYDADDPDSMLTWNISGYSQLIVRVINRIVYIDCPNPDWSGSETLTFQVTDTDALSTSGIATFTVQAVNDPPVVGDIPPSSINEGENFTPIYLDNYVFDPDDSDESIQWSYSGNSNITVTINNRIASLTLPSPDWFGQETIVFKATDPGGLWDSDEAIFTVNAVNDPPTLTDIPDATIQEGGSFQPIRLDDYVSDPDDNDSALKWSYSGNKDLLVAIVNRVATVQTPNPKWNGSETITFQVSDPAGLTVSDAAKFTVTSINDPPVVSDIPNYTITEGEQFPVIKLDDYVSDLDDADESIIWSYSGNIDIKITISNRVAAIGLPSLDWFGQETITFKASDPGGLSASDEATFTVIAVNDPPQIADIPDLTIKEGEQFPPINLNDFVNDPDDPDSLINWRFSGNVALSVSITNKIATVSTPDLNWFGEEQITFLATDPAGLMDEDAVLFRVLPENDPPFITNIPDLNFNEDDSLIFKLSDIANYVSDPDNKLYELKWEFMAKFINVSLDVAKSEIILINKPNWNGSDTVILKVTDPAGAFDTDSVLVSVNPMPDAPEVFQLVSPRQDTSFSIYPDMIKFVWQKARDVDDNDQIQYTFYFGSDSTFKSNLIIMKDAITDTIFLYPKDNPLIDGIYFWAVRAKDSFGLETWCKSIHRFQMSTSSEEKNISILPTQFYLAQNFPNPFNPETDIQYQVPAKAFVTIKIFNMLGQEIITLVNEQKQPGNFSVRWDGRDRHGKKVGSGIYLYAMYAGSFSGIKKMLFVE